MMKICNNYLNTNFRNLVIITIISLPTNTHTLAPSKPTNVVVEAKSSTSIDVEWDECTSDGGSPITNYIVEYRPTSDQRFKMKSVRGDLHTTLTNLKPSTVYEVRVKGQNVMGPGDVSEIKKEQTDPGMLIEFSNGYALLAKLFRTPLIQLVAKQH